MKEKMVRVKIRRQDAPNTTPRWEEFALVYRPNMNVIICLMDIFKNPVTIAGKRTTPVVWDSNCLENVCGACSMLINDRPRQACTALVDQLEQPIMLEPLTKFPVIRDLKVDRQRLFVDLKRANAWLPIDGTQDLGPGPRIAQETQELRYKLSTCMSCGICLEVCPQYHSWTAFMGAAVINQVRLLNLHPTGAMNRSERLTAMMAPGGVQDCGNAQNCVRACPKQLPLTESIADINRQTTWHGIWGWLNR